MMSEEGDSRDCQSLLSLSSPRYSLSSTGSLRLARVRPQETATVVEVERRHRKPQAGGRARRSVGQWARQRWGALSVKRLVETSVPLVKTLRTYGAWGGLLQDGVAGVTVGVMMIPQAMAFALVAGLPPIVGLYMALFAPLTYCLLGTGRHLSWNCVAVLGIMMGSLLDKYDVRLRAELQLQSQPDSLADVNSDVHPTDVYPTDVYPDRLPSFELSQAGQTPGRDTESVRDANTHQTQTRVKRASTSQSEYPREEGSGPSAPRGLSQKTTAAYDLPEDVATKARSRRTVSVGTETRKVPPVKGDSKQKQEPLEFSDTDSSRPPPESRTYQSGVRSDGAANLTADSVSGDPGNASSSDGQRRVEEVVASRKLELARSVTFLSGLIMAVLGKVGLGRLASFMSDSLVISFTVGVSFHVVLGQLAPALGLHLPVHSGAFKIFTLLADILANLGRTNLATLLIFAACCLVLYCVKRFVNERYAGRLKVPVPVDLLVVIIVTAINAGTRWNESHSVDIVRDIPLGVPTPTLPGVAPGLQYLPDGVVISLVAFTQIVALGKMMALKHDYSLDPNQEMFALGMASVVCSIFRGFIPGASITTTVVMDAAGGRTQVASLFVAGLVFLVVMFFGSYFYFLPQGVLAAILVVNMRGMFLKLLTVPKLWRQSRADAVVWVSTCTATVVLDTDLGLLVGMVMCVVSVLVRSRLSPVHLMGRLNVGDRHHWKSVDKYPSSEEVSGIKVVRLNCDFYFFNAEVIEDDIAKQIGVDATNSTHRQVIIIDPDSAERTKEAANTVSGIPRATKLSSDRPGDSLHHSERISGGQQEAPSNSKFVGAKEAAPEPIDNMQSPPPFQTLILDLGGVSFVDAMGVSTLERIVTRYQSLGLRVFVTQVGESCATTLMRTGFVDKHGAQVFVTTDAVLDLVRRSDSDSDSAQEQVFGGSSY